MTTLLLLTLLVPTTVWLLRWARQADKAAVPPYSFARRNAPYLFLTFFALLFAALFVTSGFSSTYTHRGLAEYRSGHYPAAQADLSRAEGLDPHNAAAPYYLGLCLRQEGQNEGALREFRAACSAVEDKKFASPSDRRLDEAARVQIQQMGGRP